MSRKPAKTTSRAKKVEISFLEGLKGRCPDDPKVLKALAELYTKTGRVEDGLAADLDLVRLCPAESEVWYNLGCSYALTGRKDEALAALSRAIDLGYEDYQWMSADGDLSSLREDPRFVSLLKTARG